MPTTVGVLFVHGIGKQAPGATLSNLGDPLLAWMRSWSVGHGLGDVTVVTAAEEPGAPRHIRADWDDDGELYPLVMAECWWAESFSPPSTAQVLKWSPLMAWKAMFRMGKLYAPLALAFFVGLYLVAPETVLLLGLGLLAALLAGTLVLPLFLVAGFVVLRVAPGTRRVATALGGILIGHVGDAWVLRRSETRFAAMRARCMTDLTWLSERCDRVVVVAHSQGSVIAAETLAATTAPRCDVFVTVGSAIRLLRLPGDDPVQRVKQARPSMTWLNVYSLLDPVSAGPITGAGLYPLELQVHNLGSALSAHTTYPGNKEEFQSVVMTALRHVRASSADQDADEAVPRRRPFTSSQEIEFQLALRLRFYRAFAKGLLRWVTPLVVPGLTLLFLRASLPDNWPDLTSIWAGTAGLFPDWLSDICASYIDQDNRLTALAIVTTFGLTMLYQGVVVGGVHRWWDRRATAQLAAGSPNARLIFPSAVLLIALAPLLGGSCAGAAMDGRHYWWAYVTGLAAIAVTVVALATASDSYRGPQFDSIDDAFLRRSMSPVFPAFTPNIEVDNARSAREITHREAAVEQLAALLADHLQGETRVLDTGQRAGILRSSGSAVLSAAVFKRHPNNDVPTFTSGFFDRPMPDHTLILVDVDPKDAADPRLEQSNFYIVTDANVGQTDTGIVATWKVTREELTRAGAGPFRLEEIRSRL